MKKNVNQEQLLLTEKDIKFISRKTKLSPKKLAPLLEESQDLFLILEQVVKKSSKRELRNLSFATYAKAIILKYSESKDFSLSEKLYISESISQFYPEIAKKKTIRISLPRKPDLKTLNFCIVLFGCFNVKKTSQYCSYLDAGLRNHGNRDLAVHLEDWFQIFETIKKDGML